MTAAELVELVERKGLVGLQEHRGCSRREAELLDVRARRMVGLGLGSWPIHRAMAAPPTLPTVPEPTPETARVLAALDRLERPPTGDELASRQAEDRRRDVEARNAKGDAARRQYAATLRRGGYAGFTGGDR